MADPIVLEPTKKSVSVASVDSDNCPGTCIVRLNRLLSKPTEELPIESERFSKPQLATAHVGDSCDCVESS